jgi:hypothetical protein
MAVVQCIPQSLDMIQYRMENRCAGGPNSITVGLLSIDPNRGRLLFLRHRESVDIRDFPCKSLKMVARADRAGQIWAHDLELGTTSVR